MTEEIKRVEREKCYVGDLRDVTIEKIVYGGDGLARLGVFTIFVPFTAVGDRVRISIVSVEKKFARGVIERFLEPAPERREPPCRHFSICGGCQLQHLPYPVQLETKVGFVRESLRRLGGIEWIGAIELISGPEFGYRSRAELKIARDSNGHPRLGYFEAGSRNLCEIESCLILHPLAASELARLRLEPESIPAEATRLHLTVGDDGAIATPATGENGRAAEIDSMGTVSQKIAGTTYQFGVKSFFQGNRLLVERLVHAAIGDARGGTAVDLYAGVGLFSLQLAKRFARVCAVEGNRISAAHGDNNARLNGVTNLTFEPVSVEAWLKYRTEAWKSPDLVLLDPPRAGAGPQVIERVADLQPSHIAYVSCDPATLARDLKGLIARGYQIDTISVADMFPQTFHVETVVHLSPIAK